MAINKHNLSEGLKQMAVGQSAAFTSPDVNDIRVLEQWNAEIKDAERQGKICILDRKRDRTYHGMVISVVVEKL